jgi:hypothetical protein
MVRDAEIGTKNTCLHAVANMKLDQRVEILAKMKPFDARTHYRVAQESKLPYFGFQKILFLVKNPGRTSKRLERTGCSGPQGLRTRGCPP